MQFQLPEAIACFGKQLLNLRPSSNGNRAMNQPGVSGPAGENFIRRTQHAAASVRRQCCAHGFSRGTRGSKKGARRWKMTPMAHGNRRLTVRPITSELGMSRDSVWRIKDGAEAAGR